MEIMNFPVLSITVAVPIIVAAAMCSMLSINYLSRLFMAAEVRKK